MIRICSSVNSFVHFSRKDLLRSGYLASILNDDITMSCINGVTKRLFRLAFIRDGMIARVKAIRIRNSERSGGGGLKDKGKAWEARGL
jgi:hypothetical protein